MSVPDYRLFVSPQAQQDIAGILRFTGKTWGRNQLLIYRDKLDEAERFISLINRERFNYTKWRATQWEGETVATLAEKARLQRAAGER